MESIITENPEITQGLKQFSSKNVLCSAGHFLQDVRYVAVDV